MAIKRNVTDKQFTDSFAATMRSLDGIDRDNRAKKMLDSSPYVKELCPTPILYRAVFSLMSDFAEAEFLRWALGGSNGD